MTRRPATREDCRGCRDEHFHQRPGGCRLLPHAVVVPMLRSYGKGSGRVEAVDIPRCYARNGLIHVPRPAEWKAAS
jgi:hypothetical protein